MPRSYPPVSTQRHSNHHHSRSTSGSRTRQGHRDVRHQPFAGEHYDDEKQSKWSKTRGHLVAMFSEFIGTTMFLWFAFAGAQAATQTSTVYDTNRLVFVCMSFGFSLMVSVWAHYRISGGLFNPAVTLALCITNNVPWFRSLLLLPAQLLGGIAAAALVSCMFPGPITVVCELGAGTTVAQGVFIEAFGTCLLVFVILMLAAEKHETTPLAPVGIGLALFVVELACVYYTGGAVNPARAFGPSVVATSFPGYHWLYWIGPIIGSLMASGYYGMCKFLNYEEANPGQDSKRQ